MWAQRKSNEKTAAIVTADQTKGEQQSDSKCHWGGNATLEWINSSTKVNPARTKLERLTGCFKLLDLHSIELFDSCSQPMTLCHFPQWTNDSQEKHQWLSCQVIQKDWSTCNVKTVSLLWFFICQAPTTWKTVLKDVGVFQQQGRSSLCCSSKSGYWRWQRGQNSCSTNNSWVLCCTTNTNLFVPILHSFYQSLSPSCLFTNAASPYSL